MGVKLGGIDPAALAAASLAAAVSVLAPEGPYKPLGAVIGVTITMLIFAYDIEPDRTGLQSLAFSMVVSLVLCLVFGYVVERFQAWIFVPTSSQTQVPDLSVALFWFCFSYLLWAVDRKRAGKKYARIETVDWRAYIKGLSAEEEAPPQSAEKPNASGVEKAPGQSAPE